MPYPRYSGGGSGGGGGGGYGGNGGRGYSSNSNVNPWQQGHGGQMTSNNKVDPLTLMGSLMGAMMGGSGGGGGQMAGSNPLHQLAGLAMASAINTGGVGADRGGRGYDRDRRERQVGVWF